MFLVVVTYNYFMPAPILATKLYLPPPRPGLVSRPHLVARLNEGLAAGHKLTLISASAGFGKTSLLGEWISANTKSGMQNDELTRTIPHSAVNNLDFRAAWLSLDESDSEPLRFLTYLISALQTIQPEVGQPALAALQTPQPPPVEGLLIGLLNEIANLPEKLLLVLDDYHAIHTGEVDVLLAFLLDHLPPQMHLAIASREDPSLPLARLRALGQLTELRAADLRFTLAEAAEFLNRVMGLNLSEADVAALEARTEGWIAGLQLAALSLQGQTDPASFIQSFTGSHRFVLDYLLEEVLNQQSPDIQDFLLCTSLLNRLCGPLCDAILGNPLQPSTLTLESLERANLFLVPLDNERRWYRYHHLFGDLLHQRMANNLRADEIDALHIRASEWYENNALPFEAFRHAAAANDIARAERLIGHPAIGLHFRSVAITILEWLASLPQAVLEAHPCLLVRSATLSLLAGKTSGVEGKLQTAETILQTPEPGAQTRDLLGQIACARATLALTRYDPATMIVQSRRALELLPPENLSFRFTTNWLLTAAYLFQGERAEAIRASQEGIAISEQSGDTISHILAASTLGQVQEMENQISAAAETYRGVLALFGDYPQPNAEEAYLGLARIHYEWNDLEAAETYAQRARLKAQQYDRSIDRFILSDIFLAQLKLSRGEVDSAAALLAQTEQTARQKNFILRLPDIAAAQVRLLLEQGNAAAAGDLARQFDLPLGQAHALLAQGHPAAALAILEPYRQQVEARAWQDVRLKTLAVQAVALRLAGQKDPALATLAEALALAEPGGFLRLFLDESENMRLLIADFRASMGKSPHKLLAYADKLLAAFSSLSPNRPTTQSSNLLTCRELEILRLIAEGLTNEQIANRLYLSLYTVKAHARNIFSKLNATNRTQATTRARELGIMQ
jgi:LuxR family transcriptional regulator, maltose regulon positive regulatory protein